MKQSVITIASKNYFSHVRTLMESLKEHKPEWDRFVVLVDRYTDEENERPLIEREDLYKIIYLHELAIEQLTAMSFNYNILELNTAVKPWALEHLFKIGYDTAVYLDPDICVYGNMPEIDEELREADKIILTPHCTQSIPDGNICNERLLMQTGVYNLGFLGLSKGENIISLLKWWQSKLENECRENIKEGLFVDQKWMDLAPCFCQNVKILRHSGYNAAYWNQSVLKTSAKEDGIYFNGQKLQFFHYSYTRYLNTDDRHIRKLLEDYIQKQLKNDKKLYKKMPYGLAVFNDGTKIYDFLRKSYVENKNKWDKRFSGDPFQYGERILAETALSGQNNPLPTIAMICIWQIRPDLQIAFPDPYKHNLIDFCDWFLNSAEKEYNISKSLIEDCSKKLEEVKNNAGQYHLPTKDAKSLVTKTKELMMKYALKHQPVLVKMIPLKIRKKLWQVYNKWGTQVNQGIAIRKGDFTEDCFDIRKNILKARDSKDKGINLYSYIKGDFGIGETGRSIAKALDPAKIPFDIIDIGINIPHCSKNSDWDHKIHKTGRYNINLVVANADESLRVYSSGDYEGLDGKYNIGLWHWELTDFPAEWMKAFNLFNEIWTSSIFIAQTFSAVSPGTVLTIPHPIELNPQPEMRRDYFKLPEDKFIFLCMYDVFSIQYRKNPHGAINAFKKAFINKKIKPLLLIKINNARHNLEELEELKLLAEENGNIMIVEKTLTRTELASLINCIDAFVSLHRSEGFGLVPAESMYLGKPVVATGWSGNMEFMTVENSCPVDYELVKLKENYGPYKAGQTWAEPNEEHAAEYMRRLVADRSYYNKIAEAGEKTIKTEFTKERAGKVIRRRLEELGLI